jgi:hypothetical protein
MITDTMAHGVSVMPAESLRRTDEVLSSHRRA